MDPNEILDRATLREWLTERPVIESVIIGQRSALRVVPIWVWLFETRRPGSPERHKLWVFRQLLAAGVAANFADADLAKATSLMEPGTNGDIASSLAASAAFISARFSLAPQSENTTVPVIGNAAAAADFANSALLENSHDPSTLWDEVRRDADAFLAGGVPSYFPLWSSGQPFWFQSTDAQVRAIWAREPEVWAFWSRWWDGVLFGQQINWDLQRAVTLIPEEDWQNGPMHIAQIIAQLEERFDLKAQVAELKAKLREAELRDQATYATVAHRSHNHPPEVLEAAVEVRREFRIVLQVLEDAENELSLPFPSPTALERIGTVLWNAGTSIAKYVLKIGDLALATTVAAGVTAVVSYECVKYAPEIEVLAKSIIEFATKLTPAP